MNLFSKYASIAALSLALPAGAALADGKEVNFGIISTEASSNLKTVWEPFLAEMSRHTGLKVNGFYASDYAGIIEAQKFGKVSVAWYGNKSAIEAVDRAEGEVFVQSVDVDGNPGYWSLLVTHVDSPLEKLDDVLKCDKSLTFGNGDPNSTSGFLVPSVFVFTAKGVDPKECYKRMTNASHETNALSAANRQVDFATFNTESMRRLQTTNPEAAKKIKVIWQSPLIPSDPIVWRKDLDADIKARIYTFFLSYGRIGAPEEVKKARQTLASLGWAPFKASSDAQLYPIRILEISKNMAKLQADDKLSAEDKAGKLKELAAEKARYEELNASIPQM